MISVRYFQDVFRLFFPDLCHACGDVLLNGEKIICTFCYGDLPYTDFHTYKNNPLARQLWGRVDIEAAMALLYFKKASKVQTIIHHIKYKKQTSVGLTMGRLIGDRLSQSFYFKNIDYIVPVPLHPKKAKKRGYNQSRLLANGIAEVLDLPIREDLLIRTEERNSQTHRNRYDRFENMMEVFCVLNREEVIGKSILLVDDVLTTGSTIEACSLKLLESGAATINVAALAYTK